MEDRFHSHVAVHDSLLCNFLLRFPVHPFYKCLPGHKRILRKCTDFFFLMVELGKDCLFLTSFIHIDKCDFGLIREVSG